MDKDYLQFAAENNLDTESEFVKLDNRIHMSGGSTSVATYSTINIVITNRYILSP